jgi:hypothetical protein
MESHLFARLSVTRFDEVSTFGKKGCPNLIKIGDKLLHLYLLNLRCFKMMLVFKVKKFQTVSIWADFEPFSQNISGPTVPSSHELSQSSVTRLGEFSPNGRLLHFGKFFLKITEVAHFLCYVLVSFVWNTN